MREEFEDIVRRESATVYRLAFSRLRNAADAEDVCQAVFLRLLNADPVFTDADHRHAWLLRTTINCCADVRRSAWRRRVHVGESSQSAARQALNCQSLQQHREQMQRDELSARIDAAMEALSEKQRTAVHLHYFEGLSGDEIANLTGDRPSTVRSHLRRARKTLERLLGDAL